MTATALLFQLALLTQAPAAVMGPPHLLVLPLHGDPAGLAHTLVRDAVTSEGRVILVDPEAWACDVDACALQQAVQHAASHVVYGDASNGNIHLRCLDANTGALLGEVAQDMTDPHWPARVAAVVPEALVTAEERVPLLWGNAGTLVVPRAIPQLDNEGLLWTGRVFASIGAGGLALALGLLVLAAMGGVLLPAYLNAQEPLPSWTGSRLAQRVAVLVLGGVGTAFAAVVGGLLVLTMTPSLVLGAVLLLASGTFLD